MSTTIRLGITENGIRYHDFSKAPHILIAGETGSGKSMMMHNIIAQAVLQYTNASMVLIDPKYVEFRVYRNNSHLWCDIANTADEAFQVLSMVLDEVQRRYKVLERTGARSGGDPLFVFIDELADLMYASRKETERLINGRLSEGYTVDDFKIVIDKKCKEWKDDAKMSSFLRPSTLFAPSHFDEYLNAPEGKVLSFSGENAKNQFNRFSQRQDDYDYEKLIKN